MTERVTSVDCEHCHEHMRQSRFVLWCQCGRYMSNNYGVFEEV